ncbi:adhesion G protein-coupled receptor E3-like [Hoplias malabaricus]|uniref:adhesion G protein-coupled receptor E3-like n=1 Tax=Hoplias malabaricus TaxID=27720 RepID=UPI003462B28D
MKTLLIFTFFLISGPVCCFDVIGYSGGTIRIYCKDQQYNGQTEKYFCKNETDECINSEQDTWVHKNRLSLRDSGTELTVLYRNLSLQDSGSYRCGETGGWSHDVELKVKRDPCCSGPSAVTGFLKETLTINCPYPEEFKTDIKSLYKKYDYFIEEVISTTQSPKQSFSISEDNISNVVSVRIGNVKNTYAGSYLCGIKREQTLFTHFSFFSEIQLQVTVRPRTTLNPTAASSDEEHLIQTSTVPPELQDYFKETSAAALLKEILNKTFTKLPQNVVIDALKSVMNDSILRGELNKNNVVHANDLLMGTERLVSALVVPVETYNITPITVPNLEIKLLMVGPNASTVKIPQLTTSTVYLDIDLIGIAEKNQGSAAVSLMSYTNFTTLQDPALFNTDNETSKTMMSPVVSVTLLRTNITQLTKPVNLTLKHTAEVDPDGELICVYWNDTEWSVDGCLLLQSKSNHSVCSCVHLSTFALIMQTRPRSDDENNTVMMVIGILAVSVGLVFLTLSLFTFANYRRNPRLTNTALINLCLTLLLAHILFLLTQIFLRYIKPLQVLCAVLAGVLHFLFLSAFVWMFIEAVLLFLLMKNLTKLRSKKEGLNWKYLVLIGYIIPVVVVGVSAGLVPKGYGSKQCWLNVDEGFVWSFLGPVAFILAANTLLFLSILIIMTSTLKKVSSENLGIKRTERDHQLFKSVFLKTMVQFVILGCSWVLGFFTNGSKVLEMIFLLLNSQQGTFIFLIHCVFNQEVRLLYVKWWRGLCGTHIPKSEDDPVTAISKF